MNSIFTFKPTGLTWSFFVILITIFFYVNYQSDFFERVIIGDGLSRDFGEISPEGNPEAFSWAILTTGYFCISYLISVIISIGVQKISARNK